MSPIDSHGLPENIRRAMLREPTIRKNFTFVCPICGTQTSFDKPCGKCGVIMTRHSVAAAQYRKEFVSAVETACIPKPRAEGYTTASIFPAPGDSITFWVPGKAEPQGSKKAYVPLDKNKNPYLDRNGRIIVNVIDDNSAGKQWKAAVARTARLHFARAPHEGPVEWLFEFVMIRPQCHFGSGRNAECVKDSAPAFHIIRPDTLKLSRSVEDSLTGIAWLDDSQVVRQTATKAYGAHPGVQITVWPTTVINRGNATPTASQPELPIVKPPPEEPLPLPL